MPVYDIIWVIKKMNIIWKHDKIVCEKYILIMNIIWKFVLWHMPKNWHIKIFYTLEVCQNFDSSSYVHNYKNVENE